MGSEHFDLVAADWDADPAKVEHARAVAAAIADTLHLAPGTRLLEYGAGTGLVSQALLGHVARVTLADSSAGMRGVLEQKVAAGLFPADTRVWALDLQADPPPPEHFNLLVTSLVLHHVRDLPRVLAGMVELLDAGGQMAIADLDREDGSFHAHHHDFDGHSGFDRATLAADLEAAGLTDVRVQDCTHIVKEGTPYPVFLATARLR